LEDEKRHVEEMASLHLRTIEALALAIEAKDQTTHDHLQRVRVYAVEVAKELGVTPDEMQAVHAAALLHDIGKLAVPEHIISKPGRLTLEEFEKMKIHPVVGAEILQRVRFPYPVVPIVRAHHEKWDGSGYPAGLKGTEIPIGARILSAVDFLDALASDRQYRRALPLNEVMQRLGAESGKSFDPQVVEILKKRYVSLEKMALAQFGGEANPLLSTDVKVERGLAPAAGFENISVKDGSGHEATFLSSIAAARQEAQTLFELSQDLGASLSLVETLSVFSVKLRSLVPYDAIAIYLRRNDELIPEYVNGDNFRLFSSLRIPVGQGLSGWVAHNRKPIINGNPSVEPGYLNDPTKFSTLRSALAIPLEGVSGVIGVLALYRSDRDAFTSDHLRILLAISSKMALAIENAVKYQQAENSATTDYLTGLPNAR
jgi:putative nucleotidyltransferase with HDIG domain